MTRVIHIADTHIGYRQYHAQERRQDFLEAFERIVDDAIELDVDAVVHAGDLFHDRRPDLADLRGTIRALARLRIAEIPFLGIVGNHERKRETQWLDLFEELDLATHLGKHPTPVGSLCVYGLDFTTPTQRDKLDLTFEPATECEVAALVTHGIATGLPHGDLDIDAIHETSQVVFDAILLGDYHEHVLEYRDEFVLTYPGSTERVSATERDPRGYNIVTVEGGEVSVTHRALDDTRPFEFIEVDLAAEEGVDRVRARLDQHELTGAVVIVTITGDGDPISPAAIERHALDLGALVARVRDQRDIEGEEADIAVRFSDPDIAVNQLLTDAKLSEAAHQVDDVVRDLDVPDSRVRERVHDRIKTLLDDDPAALGRSGSVEEVIAEEESTTEEADGEVGEAEVIPADEEYSEEPPDGVAVRSGQASMEDYL